MRPPLRVGTVYDFRNTPESGMDMPTLYAAIMDQVVMLDGLGLDLVWFTEHHFLDDGYLPSWVPMAGAIAARTRHVRLSSDVCLLPFNHPVRLAEDLAVLDNISNGRIEVGVGMGYAPHEFRGFGLPVARRVSLTDEGIEVLRHCFTGEKFSFHGKRYDFDDVMIRPRYVQPGGPPLWIAAMSEAGAQRAARNDSNFLPHGTGRDNDAALHPILLTTAEHNPNGATVRFLIDGAPIPTDAASYDRIVLMFDGEDEDAVAAARTHWTAAKEQGFAVAYWQPDEQGRWVKKA